MSLINDALIKAERERAEEAAARAAGLPVEHPKYRNEKRRRSRQLQSIPLALINAAVLLACFAVLILIMVRNRPADNTPSVAASSSTESPPEPSDPDALPATFASDDVNNTPTPAATQSGSFSDSPFASTDTFSSAPPPSSDFELVGMSAVGSNTLLSIVRRSDQRSIWIPVGKSVSGITAVSYDPDSDRAIIRVDGREHTLGLRVGSPVPAE